MKKVIFTIDKMELCLGIGWKPMPEIRDNLKHDIRIKELWKDYEYVTYTMTKFYDNRGMDSHRNSFADVEVSVEINSKDKS